MGITVAFKTVGANAIFDRNYSGEGKGMGWLAIAGRRGRVVDLISRIRSLSA